MDNNKVKVDTRPKSKKSILSDAIMKVTNNKLEQGALAKILQRVNVGNRYDIKYFSSFRAFKESVDCEDVIILDRQNRIVERSTDFVETVFGPIMHDSRIKIIHDDETTAIADLSDHASGVDLYEGKATSFNVCNTMVAIKTVLKYEYREDKPLKIRDRYYIYIFIKPQ